MRSRITVSVAVLTVGAALASVPALAQPIRHFVKPHSAATSARASTGASQPGASSFNKYDPALTGGGSAGANFTESQDGSAQTLVPQ